MKTMLRGGLFIFMVTFFVMCGVILTFSNCYVVGEHYWAIFIENCSDPSYDCYNNEYHYINKDECCDPVVLYQSGKTVCSYTDVDTKTELCKKATCEIACQGYASCVNPQEFIEEGIDSYYLKAELSGVDCGSL